MKLQQLTLPVVTPTYGALRFSSKVAACVAPVVAIMVGLNQ